MDAVQQLGGCLTSSPCLKHPLAHTHPAHTRQGDWVDSRRNVESRAATMCSLAYDFCFSQKNSGQRLVRSCFNGYSYTTPSSTKVTCWVLYCLSGFPRTSRRTCPVFMFCFRSLLRPLKRQVPCLQAQCRNETYNTNWLQTRVDMLPPHHYECPFISLAVLISLPHLLPKHRSSYLSHGHANLELLNST